MCLQATFFFYPIHVSVALQEIWSEIKEEQLLCYVCFCRWCFVVENEKSTRVIINELVFNLGTLGKTRLSFVLLLRLCPIVLLSAFVSSYLLWTVHLRVCLYKVRLQCASCCTVRPSLLVCLYLSLPVSLQTDDFIHALSAFAASPLPFSSRLSLGVM